MMVENSVVKKSNGNPVPDEFDELLEKVADEQLKADYRRSLGKEHARRNLDVEIKRIFKKEQKNLDDELP